MKRELGRSQAEVEEGLAALSDLIHQVGYLTPLEGQMTHSQVGNVNLRRQLEEHIAVYDRLKVAEQDRDRSIAEHRALLYTLKVLYSGPSRLHRSLSRRPRVLLWPDRPPRFCFPGVGIAWP